MEHLKQPLTGEESAGGTSFHGPEIKLKLGTMKLILGAPDYDDNGSGDRTNFEWDRKTSTGEIFTVYDYKEYMIIRDNDRVNWHIGGLNQGVTEQAYKEIMEAYKELFK